MSEQVVEEISQYMEIESVGTIGSRIIIVGSIRLPKTESIKYIKDRLEVLEYLPLFKVKKGRDAIECIPFLPREERSRPILNIILFIATILTTLYVGSIHQRLGLPSKPQDLLAGIPFSFSLMAILLCHEFGHYFTARKNKVRATLPFFLPIPHPLIGTFGAIIRIKTLIPNRKVLAQLGMAGPLSGFVIAVPLTIIGLFLSPIKYTGEGFTGLQLGDSILFALLAKITHPGLSPGYDIFLHPMAYAGWLGFLVTSMNLMPIGQLDGGHIAFALLGKRRIYLIPIIIILLITFGRKWIYGWLFWLGLAIFLSRREPVVQDSITTLSLRDILLPLIPYIVLILTFTPVPFAVK